MTPVRTGRVAVVLVNWNNHRDTLECLRSLQSSEYRPMDVIVVDNGSRPESTAAMRGAPGCDLLIETGANLGFTGGNNRGMTAALERGAEYVFVLNNDTIVDPLAIGTLVGALGRSPATGVVTPKIRFHQPADLLWYAGGTLTRLTRNAVMTAYKRRDDGSWDQPHEVPFASGCAMLIRREVLERVGMFVDDYFAVFEDLDLCMRVRAAGYAITYEPRAVIWHKESAASGGHESPGYVYYQVRNRFLFLSRWVRTPLVAAAAYSFAAAHCVKRAARFALRGKWPAVAAVAAGVRDGLAGRGGMRPSREDRQA